MLCYGFRPIWWWFITEGAVPASCTQRREAAQCGGRGGLRELPAKSRLCIWGSAIGQESLLGELGFSKPICGLPEFLVQRSSPVLFPACLPDNQGYKSLSVLWYQFQSNISEFTGLNFVLIQMILLLVFIHYSALILYPKSRNHQACLKREKQGETKSILYI